MSTKSTIKWREQRDGVPGFHLYEDAIDTLVHIDGEPAPAVSLRLDGLPLQVEAFGESASVTVEMPREMAVELGLLPVPSDDGDATLIKNVVAKLIEERDAYKAALLALLAARVLNDERNDSAQGGAAKKQAVKAISDFPA